MLYKPPQNTRPHSTYRLTETTKHLGTKSVGRHKVEIIASVLFELIPMGKSEQRAHKYRGFYTFDDVDSSQAIESAHQLSVSFFTLHSTFLLQGLKELLHRHGAGEGRHTTDIPT